MLQHTKKRKITPMRCLDALLRDIRFALRQLARNRVFALTVILSLGIAIGANTAIFTLLDAVVLRTLAVPQASRIVELQKYVAQDQPRAISKAVLDELRARQSVFSSVSGWLLPMLTVEANGGISSSAVLVVTPDYYSTYPVAAILGRTLQPADFVGGSAEASNVAVISEQCWRERFHSDLRVLGKTIRVEGQPFSIVGVMPAGFSSPQIDVSADATIPLDAWPHGLFNWDPSSVPLLPSARLRDGVSLQQARAQMRALWPSILRDTLPPALTPAQKREELSSWLDVESGAHGESFLRRDLSDPIRLLMIAVAMLLLLASVNVATLLLARASARSAEIGVRLALGASPARVVRQLFTESLLLAIAAAALGLLLSIWAGPFLLGTMWNSPVPLTISLQPDLRVLTFTLAAALAATVLFGLLPGWLALEEGLGASLHAGARTLVGERGRWLRRSLVSIQVALAVVLLVGAGLLARTSHRLAASNLGFDPAHVDIFQLSPDPGGYHGIDLASYERDLLARISAIPGVASAALSNSLPVMKNRMLDPVFTPATKGSSVAPVADLQFVSYGYFKTLGVSIFRGRGFSPYDAPNSRRVVVISQSLADRLFHNNDALGRAISIGDHANRQHLQVVGIVSDARIGDLRHANPFTAYLPLFQVSQAREPELLWYPTLEVRASASPLAVMPAVEAQVRSLGREFVRWAETMSRAIDANIAEERLLASLSTFFATVAGLLAVLGLFGLLSYSVNRRIREFGVRIALGAQAQNVFLSVFGEALFLLVTGLLIGVPIAVAAARILASRVSGLRAADPAVFVSASGLLAAAGALAAWAPARRASRVNPIDALRHE